MLKIDAYSVRSKSAKLLAKALDCRILRRIRSRYVPNRNDIVINWGRTDRDWPPARVLNHTQRILQAVDKRLALARLDVLGVRTVPFTLRHFVAQEWLDEGYTVVVRHKTAAKEGQGIEIVQPNGRLPNAPLYTRYIKKQAEFRIHVVAGEIIDRQQKVLPRNHQGERNFHVRNTANGFIFIREGIIVPPDVELQAVNSVRALGLDFGAVDVIWGGRNAYVLEVNTAPGITGTTVQRYAEAFRRVGQQ